MGRKGRMATKAGRAVRSVVASVLRSVNCELSTVDYTKVKIGIAEHQFVSPAGQLTRTVIGVGSDSATGI